MNVASLSGSFMGGEGGGAGAPHNPPPPHPLLTHTPLLLSPPSHSVLQPSLASFARPPPLVNAFRMQAQKGKVDTERGPETKIMLASFPGLPTV